MKRLMLCCSCVNAATLFLCGYSLVFNSLPYFDRSEAEQSDEQLYQEISKVGLVLDSAETI